VSEELPRAVAPGATLSAADVAAYRDDVAGIEAALTGAIVGQGALVRELLTAILAGGHVLLEGLPGLGKTHLVKGVARVLGQPLARVQCTPDLLPADITGSELLAPDGVPGAHDLVFRPGPIFASLVLVDEINRATARTQAALLEAMQEGQVTAGGRAHPLPAPFWVIATQNPIEVEGTYPLPEAQLDRFFFKCVVPYPSDAALREIVDVSLDGEPADRLPALVGADRLAAMLDAPRAVVVADAVKEAAVRLVLATQPDRPDASPAARDHLRYGASPRALQTLLRAGRVRALADGRGHVALEDLRELALPALRHRVLLSLESEVAGVRVDDVLARVVEGWAAGRSS
jgi:MoxR-like ATPase